MTNEKLIETLTLETESFRIEYIKQTEKWAIRDFYRLDKLSKERYTYEQFTSPGWTKDGADFSAWSIAPNGKRAIDYERGIRYRKATDRRDAALKIVNLGLGTYIEKQKALAERHYADSIIKLAARIEKKGLDLESLSVVTGHVGVNLEITFTDAAGKRVRAFTIIASGMIQRPHYRYLIK